MQRAHLIPQALSNMVSSSKKTYCWGFRVWKQPEAFHHIFFSDPPSSWSPVPQEQVGARRQGEMNKPKLSWNVEILVLITWSPQAWSWLQCPPSSMLNFQVRRQRRQDWVTVTGRDTGEVLFWASPILELVYNQIKEKSVSQDIYKVKWMEGEKEQVLSLSGKENV